MPETCRLLNFMFSSFHIQRRTLGSLPRSFRCLHFNYCDDSFSWNSDRQRDATGKHRLDSNRLGCQTKRKWFSRRKLTETLSVRRTPRLVMSNDWIQIRNSLSQIPEIDANIGRSIIQSPRFMFILYNLMLHQCGPNRLGVSDDAALSSDFSSDIMRARARVDVMNWLLNFALNGDARVDQAQPNRVFRLTRLRASSSVTSDSPFSDVWRYKYEKYEKY